MLSTVQSTQRWQRHGRTNRMALLEDCTVLSLSGKVVVTSWLSHTLTMSPRGRKARWRHGQPVLGSFIHSRPKGKQPPVAIRRMDRRGGPQVAGALQKEGGAAPGPCTFASGRRVNVGERPWKFSWLAGQQGTNQSLRMDSERAHLHQGLC